MPTAQARAQGQRIPQQPVKPAPIPTVRLVELHPVNAQGSLCAFAAVTLSGRLTIRDCRLIQQDGQRPWLSMPTKSWTDQKDGRTKYRPLIDLPEEWQKAIESAVIAAWREYQQTGILPSTPIGGRRA